MKLISLYEKLLTVYPKSYHDDYADEMSQTVLDMLADEPKPIKRIIIWANAFIELPVNVFMANFRVLESAYGNDAPSYVTRNTRLSGLLVMPFILLVIFNELRPKSLPQNPSAIDVLQFFAIGLPLLAGILCAVTILRWSYVRHKAGQKGVMGNLVDIKHNWPLAVMGGFGLAIVMFMVGHDSIQCLSANPIKDAQNFSATVQCISQD